MNKITIPYPSVILLIGISGSGKTTFANKHFKPSEILSSDNFRKMISGDENDQSVTKYAFELLHSVASKRLEQNKLIVIDATNVQNYARNIIIRLTHKHSIPSIAIIFNLPIDICKHQNSNRHRVVPTEVIERQHKELINTLYSIKNDDLDSVYILSTTDEINDTCIEYKNKELCLC